MDQRGISRLQRYLSLSDLRCTLRAIAVSQVSRQANANHPPLFYLKLGLLCPIKKPPAVRRQTEQQLSEDTAIKNVTLDPHVYRPSHCVLSLCIDGGVQTTGSLIKGLGGAGWETGAVSRRVFRAFYVIG